MIHPIAAAPIVNAVRELVASTGATVYYEPDGVIVVEDGFGNEMLSVSDPALVSLVAKTLLIDNESIARLTQEQRDDIQGLYDA